VFPIKTRPKLAKARQRLYHGKVVKASEITGGYHLLKRHFVSLLLKTYTCLKYAVYQVVGSIGPENLDFEQLMLDK
jgi:hypothetical protein